MIGYAYVLSVHVCLYVLIPGIRGLEEHLWLPTRRALLGRRESTIGPLLVGHREVVGKESLVLVNGGQTQCIEQYFMR